MKKTSTILTFLIFVISIWAQSPNKLSYQAVVRNADGSLVSEQTVGMQVSILQSSAAGTAVYTETHTPTSNANGLVTLEIGSGATADDFSAIDWATGPYFIKTEIDPAGSTNYTITGTSQLLSVPYARYADKAGNVFSGDYGDLSNTPTNVSDFTNDEGYITEISGDEPVFAAWDKDTIELWKKNDNNISFAEGNVAIGTNNPPERPLIVYHDTHSFMEFLTSTSGTTATSGLVVGINSAKNSIIRNYEDGDLQLGTNGGTNMTIMDGGNVGIGTTTPGAKLEVNGTTKLGSSGLVFSELREITGTTSATLSYVILSLPTGYDEGNTRVINLEINYLGDRWSGLGHDNGGGANKSTSYLINGSLLYIYYPDLDIYKDRAVRALILKVE